MNAINRAMLRRDLAYNSPRICLATQSYSGETIAYAALTFHEIGRHEPVPDDGINNITEEACQELMDCLWLAGFKPTDAAAGDAQVEAIKSHLLDMRSITSELLEIGLPGVKSNDRRTEK